MGKEEGSAQLLGYGLYYVGSSLGATYPWDLGLGKGKEGRKETGFTKQGKVIGKRRYTAFT
jgi:hypothetical protein